MQEFTLTIGGRAIRTQGSFNVLNPANETVVAACPQGTPNHLDQAVAAARAALPTWSSLPDAERAAKLNEIASVIESHLTELANLITSEQGKRKAVQAPILRPTAASHGRA